MKTGILSLVAVCIVMLLAACGGSGGGNNNMPTVTVSPATANVQEGGTQQFTATVTNTTSTAVNWSVNGVAGGNASAGTISSSGLYTAPDVVPSPASVTISAALQSAPSISGNSIVTVTAVTFSNSSIKGNYIFTLSGIDGNGYSFYAAGAITADGNGNITAGEEDLNDVSSGYFQATSVTGTYSVGADGRGTLNLNSSLGQFSYAIALRALSNAGLNEIDNQVVNATGNLEQQSTGVTAPSGSYAFGFSGVSGCGSLSSDGIFNLGSGNVGGLQDANCGGTITQASSVSGSYGSADGFGRGTGSFTGNSGSADFVYYVVSPNRYRFVCPDSATLFLGAADLQTQSSFANTDFTGSYVLNTSGSTQRGVAYILIQLNASNGSISSGYYDVNDTGVTGQASLTGAYSLASSGRINGSFTVNSSTLPFTVYLSSPTQGYYLDLRTNVIGGGNIYGQSSGVTSNAAWAGSYATKQFGYFVASNGTIGPLTSTSVSGQISADGNGTLAGTLDFNDPSNIYQGQILQGSYTVGTTAPGRFTASISTPIDGTRNYVGYIVSPTRVLLLDSDTGLTAGGDAIRQF
ncbi:MAG TPA: hypothetical protein VMD98_09300 [Bryocella sp.]|nr:hypothetical protein [Bryocella sp.]